jgi:hypothetical protein
MFLPVLLIRDYGVAGWIVFAIPNVLGAAAMGFVIREVQTSDRILQFHRHAITAFSTVTASFNFFFAIWFVFWLVQPWHHLLGWQSLPKLLILPAVTLALPLLWRLPINGQARVVLLISLVAFAIVAYFVIATGAWPPLSGARPKIELLYLAPICVIGFGACPYLDATFHWPISRLNASERHRAFGVGFGVIFFAMIVFTLLYARAAWISLWVTLAVAVHGVVQAMWTERLHRRVAARAWRVWPYVALAVGAAAALSSREVVGPLSGETIYLCFLAFYALIFPAYVLIVMLPARGGELVAPNKRVVLVWVAVVLICLPGLWEGFILEHRLWLLPIIFLVLAARAVAIRPMNLSGTVQHG